MKSVFPIVMLLLISMYDLSAQTAVTKKDPVGKWKFEAPYAPEGYTSGTIDLGFAEDKYSATISFTGSDYKIPGENVKFEKDTVSFIVYVEGTNVTITLKMADATKMEGNAVYYEGDIPLTLVREETKKQQN
jgi:hypothetical protein